jgi:hypothetical protein
LSTVHNGAVEQRETPRAPQWILIAASAIGSVTWLATTASTPRYSYGAEEDLGNPAFIWILTGFAVVGGFVFRRHAPLIGLGLGVPPLVLSPWTAPRGDNDGLWILIIPMLVVFVAFLVAVAMVGAWLRNRAGVRNGPSG